MPKDIDAEGYVVDFGPVSLVFAKTDKGTVGCGIFDIETFQKFHFAAAKAKGSAGPIKNIEDLLEAEIVAVNEAAKALGVETGMTGREALEKM